MSEMLSVHMIRILIPKDPLLSAWGEALYRVRWPALIASLYVLLSMSVWFGWSIWQLEKNACKLDHVVRRGMGVLAGIESQWDPKTCNDWPPWE